MGVGPFLISKAVEAARLVHEHNQEERGRITSRNRSIAASTLSHISGLDIDPESLHVVTADTFHMYADGGMILVLRVNPKSTNAHTANALTCCVQFPCGGSTDNEVLFSLSDGLGRIYRLGRMWIAANRHAIQCTKCHDAAAAQGKLDEWMAVWEKARKDNEWFAGE